MPDKIPLKAKTPLPDSIRNDVAARLIKVGVSKRAVQALVDEKRDQELLNLYWSRF